DPYAVLPGAVALERLEMVPWRHSQILERDRRVKEQELAPRHPLDRSKTRGVAVMEQRLRVAIAERANHRADHSVLRNTAQALGPVWGGRGVGQRRRLVAGTGMGKNIGVVPLAQLCYVTRAASN